MAYRYFHLVQAGGEGLEGQPFSAGAIAADLPGAPQSTPHTSHHLCIGLLQDVPHLAQLHITKDKASKDHTE